MCSRDDFVIRDSLLVVSHFLSGSKRMAWKWLCQLEQEYLELAERANAMNHH
jgi:hypothetical protein